MERLRERADVAECEARGLLLPWVVMFPRATVYEYTVLGVAQKIREGRWRAGIQRKRDAAIRRWRLSESQDPRRPVVLHVISGLNPGGRSTKHGVEG